MSRTKRFKTNSKRLRAAKKNARTRARLRKSNNAIVLLAIISCVLVSLLFVGCAEKSLEVYIPTKCEIEKPKLKAKSPNVAENTRNLVIYAKELECALDFCVSGEISQNCGG